MDLTIGPVTHAGEWALRISEAVKAETYINPAGGRDLFSPTAFRAHEISLQFLEPEIQSYDQGKTDFVPGLSIIDCLMWLGARETRRHIERFRIVDA